MINLTENRRGVQVEERNGLQVKQISYDFDSSVVDAGRNKIRLHIFCSTGAKRLVSAVLD